MSGGVLERLRGGLIVSCQAPSTPHPLRHSDTIARLAAAAAAGGAVAVRVGGLGGVQDIAATRASVALPIIGLTKAGPGPVYITPTLAAVRGCLDVGADVIAIDGTGRDRHDRSTQQQQYALCRAAGVPAMADVADADQAVAAAADGATIIGTTLAGYTGDRPRTDGPDLQVLQQIRALLPAVFLIAEGRYHRPDDVRAAFALGADAVVVGTAITDIEWLTRSFVAALPG
ncbi:MAG: putative N-acetylmannosamine-6-phosphate 2-epimerase [Nakamurella sp.]